MKERCMEGDGYVIRKGIWEIFTSGERENYHPKLPRQGTGLVLQRRACLVY